MKIRLMKMKNQATNPKRGKWIFYPVLCLTLILTGSCGYDPIPKPRGYFRIALPQKVYQLYDTSCPFTFEYPAYASIVVDTMRFREKCWMDIHFPQFKGDIHLSYKHVDGNLDEYMEHAYQFKMRHMSKATQFNDSLVASGDKHVYGMTYQIKGTEAASPYQFYLTDSVNHFVRGSLYFRVVPNNDSLEPVIRFIISDLEKMISSFRWKEETRP